MNSASKSYGRDLRLDVFRGLALLCIFIDHTPGNRLTSLTIRNLGFSDASELFVFISAYAAGLVYMARAERDGLASVRHRVWQRAAQIYGAHILLLVGVSLLAGWLTRTLNNPQFVQGLNVAPFLEHPRGTLVAAFALAFQPTFMNILPLYIVLFVCFPPLLWMARRSQLLAIGLSFGLYVVTREWQTTPWLANPFGSWQFNPLAWQLLFVIGVSLGVAAQQGRSLVPRSRVLLGVAVAYVIWALWVGAGAWGYDGNALALPHVLQILLLPVMDRANLSLWRLAHLLSLTYLVTGFLRADSHVLRWRAIQPLVMLGQHSLPLFCVGVVLSIAGWVAFTLLGSSLAVQVLVNGLGSATLVAVAWLLSLRTRAGAVAFSAS